MGERSGRGGMLKLFARKTGLSNLLRPLIHDAYNTGHDFRARSDAFLFAVWKRRIDLQALARQLTVVILTVDDDHHYDRAISALDTQQIGTTTRVIVRNVSPVSLACQKGLDRVQTPYFAIVDADMILAPDALLRLMHRLTTCKSAAMVTACLFDPIQGSIDGVHAYRTDVIRRIGFHPFSDDKAHDEFVIRRIGEEGHSREHLGLRYIAGDHHPDWRPIEAYWKYRFISEKLRYYSLPFSSWLSHFESVLDYHARTKSAVAFYALGGLFDGWRSKDPGKELTYAGRDSHPDWLAFDSFVHQWLREHSATDEGAKP